MSESTVDAVITRFDKEFGELAEIFTKIRDAVWISTPPPDFSRIQKDEDVLALLTVLRAVCRERIIKIIDRPSVDWKVIYQRANSLCDTIHEPRNLAALFYYDLYVNGLHSSLKLLQSLRSLIKLDLNTAYTYGELINRINNRRLAFVRSNQDHERDDRKTFPRSTSLLSLRRTLSHQLLINPFLA